MHQGRLASGGPTLAAARDDQQQGEDKSSARRLMQDNINGITMDTIAIVLTVLVGAAGYLVQIGRR